MANLVETISNADSNPIYPANVTQIGETAGTNGLLLGTDDDPVDEQANLNKPFQELARRTNWLRAALAALGITPSTTAAAFKSANGIADEGADATDIATNQAVQVKARASVAEGRLSLVSGDSTPSADVTGATTLYYTAHKGSDMALWNSADSRWDIFTLPDIGGGVREISLSIPNAADTLYDVFAYLNSGTATLEFLAWSNSTPGSSARATEIEQQDGVWVKVGDRTRRYLGTILTTEVVGECEVSKSGTPFVGVWNINHRKRITLKGPMDAVGDYSYLTAAWRKAYGTDDYRLIVVCGRPQEVEAKAGIVVRNYSSFAVGIGENSTTVNKAQLYSNSIDNAADRALYLSFYAGDLPEGRNFIQLLEWGGGGTATGSYVAASVSEDGGVSGIFGEWEY